MAGNDNPTYEDFSIIKDKYFIFFLIVINIGIVKKVITRDAITEIETVFKVAVKRSLNELLLIIP